MNINALSGNLTLPKIGYGSRIKPMRDWMVLVVVSLLLLGGFAIWATWLFVTGANEDTTDELIFPHTVLSPELLQNTDLLFTERALEASRYQTEYQFVDPSLLAS